MMFMSRYEISRQQSAQTTIINSRIGLLGRLLRAVHFVNVDITHNRAERQIVIVWRARNADARPLLRIIDPALEQWRWPVADVWHSADRVLGECLPLCQVRIDITAQLSD